jgi:4-hydroxy-tetrahydrodipicolinate synthase
MKALIEAYVASRTAEAASMHRRLLPLFNAVMMVGPNVVSPMGVKHALNQLGFNVGGLRPPLCELDENEGRRVMNEVRRHQIDLPVGV